METTTVGALLFVVVLFPTHVFGLVATLGQELVEHVLAARCGRHTCYGIPHHYIMLSVVTRVATRHTIALGAAVASPRNHPDNKILVGTAP
jgi:hypothetical protein